MCVCVCVREIERKRERERERERRRKKLKKTEKAQADKKHINRAFLTLMSAAINPRMFSCRIKTVW